MPRSLWHLTQWSKLSVYGIIAPIHPNPKSLTRTKSGVSVHGGGPAMIPGRYYLTACHSEPRQDWVWNIPLLWAHSFQLSAAFAAPGRSMFFSRCPDVLFCSASQHVGWRSSLRFSSAWRSSSCSGKHNVLPINVHINTPSTRLNDYRIYTANLCLFFIGYSYKVNFPRLQKCCSDKFKETNTANSAKMYDAVTPYHCAKWIHTLPLTYFL